LELQLNIGSYDISEEIKKSLQAAYTSIILKAKEPELSVMGPTVVLAFVKNGLVYYSSLGDSRIYKTRDDAIQQITRTTLLCKKW
jgi:serine/threonine protein phosphatase PrpC